VQINLILIHAISSRPGLIQSGETERTHYVNSSVYQ